jgi:hypothetical protein
VSPPIQSLTRAAIEIQHSHDPRPTNHSTPTNLVDESFSVVDETTDNAQQDRITLRLDSDNKMSEIPVNVSCIDLLSTDPCMGMTTDQLKLFHSFIDEDDCTEPSLIHFSNVPTDVRISYWVPDNIHLKGFDE